MNTAKILEIVFAKKGQIATLETKKAVKMKKGQPAFFKASKFQARVGVNYENLATTKEGRNDGTLPEENAGLPWGKWVAFPYLIEHNGKHYVRLTAFDGNKYPATFTDENGNVVDKDVVKAGALASEFKTTDDAPSVFNIPLENIVSIK